MPAEKTDRHTAADTVSADSLEISFLRRYFPDRWQPDPLSALSRGQNPAGLVRVYSRGRTSGCAIQLACCFSLPMQKPALRSRANPGVRASAVLLATSDGCKAADLMENELVPRSLAQHCLT